MIKVGGRSYVSSPPAFSNGADKLLVCTGNTVSIFSTSTGLLVNELEGHGAPVTSVIVVPVTTLVSRLLTYCWTASLDGTIRYWDFSVPELIKTIEIRFPIHSMVIPGLLSKPADDSGKPPDLFAYICTEYVKQEPRWAVQKFNLTKARLSGGVTLAETLEPRFITISPLGDYIGIYEKRKIRIWQIPKIDSDHVVFKRMRLHHTKTITSFAFHPNKRIVAAGDITGRILVWRGVGYQRFKGSGSKLLTAGSMNDVEENPGVRGNDDAESCTTWHWHSAEVSVLFFSPDGAYLYSGGKEGVLVLWQLETGKKKFLPRIGSPLLYFTSSSDPTLSSISCADNHIHLLKMPSIEILRSISGIKPPSSASKWFNCSWNGVDFNHANGLVAICTDNYRVQIYSLFSDREISEVQVCERNYQPGDGISVIVNLVVLSPDGSIMGTVDTRLPEDGIGGLVSLKFWERGPQSKDFRLSTVVYEAHRDAGILGIAFHPTRQMAASCSFGGDFKIWVHSAQVAEKNQMHQSSGWSCHAVGSYKKKKMTAVAFSTDGSVLAVAAENVITLWDPCMNILVAVIGETIEPITALSFVGESDYLVSASRGSNPQLSIWSMSKLSVSWSYKLHAEAISCALGDSCFAVLTLLPTSSESEDSTEGTIKGADGVILLFSVGNPIPVSVWLVSKAQGGGLSFISTGSNSEEEASDQRSSELLAYINGIHEYILLDPHGKQGSLSRQILTMGRHTNSVERELFGYASVYGELPEFDSKGNQAPISLPSLPSERPWETIFSGPSHTLPPLTKLCSVFMESLLPRRSTTLE